MNCGHWDKQGEYGAGAYELAGSRICFAPRGRDSGVSGLGAQRPGQGQILQRHMDGHESYAHRSDQMEGVASGHELADRVSTASPTTLPVQYRQSVGKFMHCGSRGRAEPQPHGAEEVFLDPEQG